MTEYKDIADICAALRLQAKTRKTIDLDLLRQYVATLLNHINLDAGKARVGGLEHRDPPDQYGWQRDEDGPPQRYFAGDRATYLDGVVGILEPLLHNLGIYEGFHSRMWEAFVMLQGWHTLVTRLHTYDDTHETRLYWDLLTDLEYGQNCHHGVPRIWHTTYDALREEHTGPTAQETSHADKIKRKYERILREKEI